MVLAEAGQVLTTSHAQSAHRRGLRQSGYLPLGNHWQYYLLDGRLDETNLTTGDNPVTRIWGKTWGRNCDLSTFLYVRLAGIARAGTVQHTTAVPFPTTLPSGFRYIFLSFCRERVWTRVGRGLCFLKARNRLITFAF